jgi:hypothetical protein
LEDFNLTIPFFLLLFLCLASFTAGVLVANHGRRDHDRRRLS